ncbi:MAG: trimeric autotransporter adhesin [Acidobacteriota bacterium]|nr:trimeric autotransporter adhesin [Acidobacteriota bacterium]
MKKSTVIYLFIFLLFMGFLSSISCKRNSQGDPNMKPPAGYRVILSGTANPSSLYVPRTAPAVSSHITVTAKNNDGTPVTGKTVVFQAGNYGYLDGNQLSDVRTTNSSGVAEINFYIPPAAPVSMTETVYISATLVDETGLDNTYAQVYDVIPIQVIPYVNQGFLITGHVYTPALVGIGEVVVQLKGDEGHASGTTVSLLPTGEYGFYVAPGWYGSIIAGADTGETTPDAGWAGITAASEYTFTPTEYPIASGVSTNIYNLDFIATETTVTNKLSTDILTWDAPNSGGSQVVNVYNLSKEAQIAYAAIPNINWLTVSPSSGTTPGNFTMTASENTTTATRSGKVTITATNTLSAEVVITVTQLVSDVTPSLAATPADIYVPASGNVKYTVTVSNPTTDDVLNWTLDSDATWLGIKPTSGDTLHNDEFEVKIQGANPSSSDRVGKIYITATENGAVAIVKVRQQGS